ncbi:MAG TPA: class I SAM-dependent methyltransferase [Methanosarcinaceae archaeon]|nr:class I SAM-dependent methyltransferase [Methanosarcinaceae archaeon]
MILQDLLGIKDEIYLVEPGYHSQKNIVTTISYLKDIQKVAGDYSFRAIRITDGTKTTGLAIFNERTEEVPVDFWSIFLSSIASQSIEEFESLADSILDFNPPERVVEVAGNVMNDALIEYYSILLVNRETCNECTMPLESYKRVYAPDRVSRLSELLKKLAQNGISIDGDVLEICCGNGMSTIALHELGIEPTTIEYEKCTVCQGLMHGVLDPKKTIVMDATMLSNFFEHGRFDCVVGFMLGTIYEFNKEMWARMMFESAKVSKEGALMLFTVNSKSEMDILESALRMIGIEGEVMDNTDKLSIYDQWVFIGKRAKKL